MQTWNLDAKKQMTSVSLLSASFFWVTLARLPLPKYSRFSYKHWSSVRRNLWRCLGFYLFFRLLTFSATTENISQLYQESSDLSWPEKQTFWTSWANYYSHQSTMNMIKRKTFKTFTTQMSSFLQLFHSLFSELP